MTDDTLTWLLSLTALLLSVTALIVAWATWRRTR
jgi:hypothetical protein